MNIDDAFKLLIQRSDSMLTYWSVYIGMCTAIITFIAGTKRIAWLSNTVCTVITAGFSIFACGNIYALNRVRIQQEAVIQILPTLEHYTKVYEPLLEAVRPLDRVSLITYHVLVDIVVACLIWVIVIYRRRNPATATQGSE